MKDAPYATREPFERRFFATRGDLVAARWWHEGMIMGSSYPTLDLTSRRNLMLMVGGSVASLLFVGAGIVNSVKQEDDGRLETFDALEAQRQRGWNVGATETMLRYDGAVEMDAAGGTGWRNDLESLAGALVPRRGSLTPYYVPTLFQVLNTPDFRVGFFPIHNAGMDRAEAEGRALADLFRDRTARTDTALLIDANGPDAVAAAVGVADLFDPVFMFDNWPHPRGVVPSHEVIAAAVYYRPTLEAAAKRRSADAPPAFVIDSRRLKPYRDESDAFDNRYLAKLPGAQAFKDMGVRHLLYVSDVPVDREPDDLNDDFVALGAGGIDVKMVALSDFRPVDEKRIVYGYGGSYTSHVWFWHSYGWYTPASSGRRVAAPAPVPVTGVSNGASYRPAPRATIFSSRTVGGLSGVGKQKPSGFGRVSLRTSTATGAVSIGRSGSFGRSRSSYSG